ncbi:MAG: hypothetical protein ACLR8P_18060 [Clostridium fessum]
MDVQKLQNLISEKREQMVADMIEMSSIPAVNPKMGGTGEYARMQWIMRWFDKRQIPMRYTRFRTKMSKKACAST